MIPSNALALVVFLVAVSPGYLYQRVVERRLTRRTRGGVLDLVDLLCVGALCTGLAALAVLGLGAAIPSAFVKLSELFKPPAVLDWRYILSAVVTLILAAVLAYLLALIVVRQFENPTRLGTGSVWTATVFRYLAKNPGRKSSIYAVVQLKDGRVLGGILQLVDTSAKSGEQDLAIAAPMFMVQAGSTEREPLSHDFVIIPASEVGLLYGKVVSRPAAPAATGPDVSKGAEDGAPHPNVAGG
ncbi:hypothetical protein ACTI_28750 [Actinoplanes sp. OR16]|uniref:DUF6338 family protein n=1 Tax=Actinoplanes sp. OR16 TaxID=946334 RepID=UPI000F7174B3|nr:DUF6338 family protein [Actinoplanes sp. OR16]BBH66190.1 hypothetical protein ACTI_28750 [Actinoplanes sp. OR16]